MRITGKFNWAKHFDFFVLDMLSMILAFLLSHRLKFNHIDDVWMRYILVVSLINLAIIFFTNPYSGIFKRNSLMEIISVGRLTLTNLLIGSLIIYVFKEGSTYSREVTAFTYGFFFVISTVLRCAWKRILISTKVGNAARRQINLFLIGDRANVEQTIGSILDAEYNIYEIVGVHLLPEDTSCASANDTIQGFPIVQKDFLPYILSHNKSEVLMVCETSALPTELYEELSKNGIAVSFLIESSIGIQGEDQSIQNYGIYKALRVRSFYFTPSQTAYFFIKRLIDILIGLICLVPLVPVSLCIKLLYLKDKDYAPIFYRQERIGKEGKKIRIWKYRTMVPNADELLQKMLQDEKWRKEWDENQKFEQDPRITRIGEILRKTSIDELPQIINVLKGDMSLVGPRPLVEGELENHGGVQLYRKVKPGITGWWACNGRSNIDYHQRLEYEYYYVKNCSFQLDVLIVLRTLWAVIKKDGAR